ncbi:hypothetical protein SEA_PAULODIABOLI_70 [Microbacterium phage PauloDiaboli]|nr:hypothetical protein SEA_PAULODIABOLI_70 [Microbacterium phage PauloDiaboli]QWY83921.1 hypothetical protein SEA_A3WALLY_71 [Microbacterium phage A3Wally]
MASLEDLKTEQELLIRTIKAQKEGAAALVFGSSIELEPVENRLAEVNRQIAALED